MSEDDLVVIMEAPDQLSAYAIKSLLDCEGIPAVLMGERSSWDYSPGGHPEYYAKVAVSRGFLEKAQGVLQAYQSGAENVKPKPCITPRYDNRHTVRGWKYSCIFMAAVSTCIAVLMGGSGYCRWQPVTVKILIPILGFFFILIGASSSEYFKMVHPRFHPTIKFYRMGNFLFGATIMLVLAHCIGLIPFPRVAFLALSGASVAVFIRAALHKIEDN